VIRRPDVPVARADEGGHVRGVREGVERQHDPSGGTCEQLDVEPALKGRDPFRHGLLRHAEFVGGALQLSELGRADERSHRLGVHRPGSGVPNCSLWLAGRRLSDPRPM
jgi:hypothetical protein